MRIISLGASFMNGSYTFISPINILGINVYVPDVMSSFFSFSINNSVANGLITPNVPPDNIVGNLLYFGQNTKIYLPLSITEVTSAFISKSSGATVNIFYEFSDFSNAKKQDVECT